MVTEIDCLMAGFVGGFIASFSIIGSLMFHFKSRIREFAMAKEDFKLRQNVAKLIEDSETYKIQLAAIHAEIYNQFVEDEYK